MWIYYLVFLMLACCAFIRNKDKKYLVFPILLFAIFYICKARVGTDYHTYKAFFDSIRQIKDWKNGGVEIGYGSLSLLFRGLHLSFQLMTMAMSSFVVVMFFKGTRNFKSQIGITLFLSLYYVFYPTLEALRQEIPLILFYYSLSLMALQEKEPLIHRKTDKQFFLYNLIGLSFHRSAVTTFLFYFFQKKRVYKVALIAFFALFALLQPLILKFLYHFPAIYGKYVYYLQAKQASGSGKILSLKLIEYVLAFCILLFLKCRTKTESIALDLVELGIVLQVFLSPVFGATYRMLYYCDIGIILFYSSVYERIRKASWRMLYISSMILYIGIRFWRIFPFGNELFIYHFLF